MAITRPGQDARVTFIGSAGQHLWLGITGVSGFTASSPAAVGVFAPNGAQLVSPSFHTADQWEFGPLPAAGEYVIVFDPSDARTGSWTTRLFPTVTPPPSPDVLALDPGTTSSPVLNGYQALTPASAWNPASGHGWVGTAPQSRDRSGTFDPLRRDFVNDTVPLTLRIAVPAGTHDAYVLVGDGLAASHPTRVRTGGGLLAETRPLHAGEFQWITFELDGGVSGAEMDLELSSISSQHCHLNALLLDSQ